MNMDHIKGVLAIIVTLVILVVVLRLLDTSLWEIIRIALPN